MQLGHFVGELACIRVIDGGNLLTSQLASQHSEVRHIETNPFGDVLLQPVEQLCDYPVRQPTKSDLSPHGDRRLDTPELLLVTHTDRSPTNVFTPPGGVRWAVRVTTRHAFPRTGTHPALTEGDNHVEVWLVDEIFNRHVAPLAGTLMGTAQTRPGSRGPLAGLDPAWIVAESTMTNAWHLDEVS